MTEKDVLDAYMEMYSTSANQYNTPTDLHTKRTAMAILTVGRLLVNVVSRGFKDLNRSINSKR